MSIQILGTGSYVPEKIVTNDDLSKMVETSDEWITQRVGVRERHVSVHESAAEMGAIAAQRALEAADITADQLGLTVALGSDPECDRRKLPRIRCQFCVQRLYVRARYRRGIHRERRHSVCARAGRGASQPHP